MLFLSQGFNKIIGFLFLPYLSRVLSYTDYGTYGQVLLTGNVAVRFFSFGLASVIFVFYARNKDKEAQIFQNNLFAILAVGILSAVLLFSFAESVASYMNNNNLTPLLKIYAWVIPLIMINSSLDSTLIYFNKIKSSARILVFSNLISISLMIWVIQFDFSLLNFIIAICLGILIKTIILFLNIPKKLFQPIFSFSLKNIKEQLWIGFPLGITLILGFLFKYTDSIMISNMLGTESYAIYRNGAIELPFVAAFYGAIAKLLLPDISKLYANGEVEKIVSLKKRVVSYTSIIIFPIALYLIFFSQPLIENYLGSKYLESSKIFAIYSGLLLFRINNYGDIFTAANKNFEQVIIYVILILINIPLNFFFIKNLGSYGAAIATLIAFNILIAALFVRSSKILLSSISKLLDFPFLLKVFTVCSICSFLTSQLYFTGNNILFFICNSIIYLVSILTLFYYLNLVPSDLVLLIINKKNIKNQFIKNLLFNYVKK